MVLIYVSVSMTALLAFLTLAIDWGRVQVAKTELQNATTAAARAALIDMVSGKTIATNSAVYYGGLNKVDGTAMVLSSTDITVGTWDPTAKTFTANTTAPNAVCVKGVRNKSRGTAIPVSFGAAIGITTCDISCTAIASQANDVQVDITSFYNNRGTAADGVTYSSSLGIGNNGYAYSDTSIAGVVTRGSTPYTISRAATNCFKATGQTITLPAGQYKSLILIVGQAYGPATSTIKINNNDSTITSYSQVFSDWCNVTSTITNQEICGAYTYRSLANGSKNTIANYLMSYEFPITNTSGATSVTLPTQSNLNIFAVGLTPAASITVR